jgi:hypothetical protein
MKKQSTKVIRRPSRERFKRDKVNLHLLHITKLSALFRRLIAKCLRATNDLTSSSRGSVEKRVCAKKASSST